MTKIIVTLISVILFTTNVLAQQRYDGISAFAALSKRFPCKTYLRAFRGVPRPATAVLYGTFGDDFSCLNNFIRNNEGKPHLVEIHFSNESCRRSHRCYEGEFFPQWSTPKYNRELRAMRPSLQTKITRRVNAILAKIHPASTSVVVLSTGLEDNLFLNSYLNLYASIKDVWPYLVVRNPEGSHAVNFGFADGLELHGLHPDSQALLCSNDGNPLTLQAARNYVRQTANCEVRLLWSAHLQGIFSGFVRPRLRSFDVPKELTSLLKLFIRNEYAS